METPSITPPVQPQIVLSYIAAGVLAIMVLFLVAYTFVWIYGILRYGGLKRLVKRLGVGMRALSPSLHRSTPKDIEATDPFQTPRGASVSPPGGIPEWALKYKAHLESKSSRGSATTSPISPASTCEIPCTPDDPYPRGLGITVNGSLPPEATSHGGICPEGPMIVIQCDGEAPQIWNDRAGASHTSKKLFGQD